MKRSTRHFITATLAALAMLTPTKAACATTETSPQGQFFNLTAPQVQIGSVLPVFQHEFALPKNYSDSVFEVRIVYPEFIDMHEGDIARVKAMQDFMPGELPEIETHIGVQRKRATLYASFCPVVFRDGHWQKLVSFKLELQAKPASAARKTNAMTDDDNDGDVYDDLVFTGTSDADCYAANSVLADGKWIKISVSQTGIHQLTNDLIRRCGFSDPSKVKIYGYGGALQPEKVTRAYLQNTDDLKELPTCTTAGGKRLFFAYGPVNWSSNTITTRSRNPYSTTGCYFLTDKGDDAPQKISESEFLSKYGKTTASYHSIYEVDDYAWFHGGRNLYNATVIGSQANGINCQLQSNGGSGRVTLSLSYDGYFEAELLLNDSLVGTAKPSSGIVNVSTGKLTDAYSKAASTAWNFSVAHLRAGTNKVTVRQTAGEATLRLDYVQITMQKPLPTPALDEEQWPQPQYVYGITNQNHHADTQADMVIIIPTSQKFYNQALRLADWHSVHDSLRVTIIPADELFNEFSSGTPDANAYRRYMKMLYDRAGDDEKEMPRYLLLFGDGAWDNRMLSPDWAQTSPDDFLLCFESENSFSETKCFVSDDFFTMLDEGEGGSLVYTDKGDIAVGRLPARTEEEAKVLVDKIVSYAANEYAGAWQNTICMMGDDGNDNLHMNDAEVITAQIEEEHPAVKIKKVYWDAFQRQTSATGNSYPDVTRLIKQQMQEGALVMNYTGHGAAYCLSHEKVVLLSDFAESTSLRLPLWLTASCDVMPFDGQEETIGETAMLNSNGGSIAFYGTTRTVYALYNRMMNRYFMHHVLSTDDNGKRVSIGEAVRLAKNQLMTRVYDEAGKEISGLTDFTENKLQYSLLGDPALVLALPTTQLTIDSINGQSTDSITKLSAGTLVRVSGHIAGHPGFRGIATICVRDVEEEVTGRSNDSETKSPIVFLDRPNTLYEGQDSVVNGRFTITFALPRDISYSSETGLINAYAVSNDHQTEAHGRCNSFSMDGTESVENSGKGPQIYCYLNKPSFSNGDVVNQTPYFYAELSDEDGINASGSGIGHDLQLIIDGQMSATYNLNDYFQYHFGDYRSGTVGYSIPTLTDGEHRLLFRAWDVLNNPTTAELNFTVQSGLTPTGIDVVSSRNPATTSTTFIISHDRIGSQLHLILDIFDASGRLLWQHQEDCVPTSSTYTVDWNLCASQGYRLPPGIYFYRVRLASEGSDYASKSRKLIIVK